MDIISKNKKSNGTAEYTFGNKASMVDRAKKIGSFKNTIKPKTDYGLKIRSMTGPEKVLSEARSKYQKNGKTTFSGAGRLMIDIGKKMFGRSFLGED